MSYYIVANIAVRNWEDYGTYQAGFMDIFGKYKGELLAVSDEPHVIEGEWPYTRLVVLRFPDEDEARRWYESPEYQALSEHRWRGSVGAVVACEGLS